MPYIVPPAPTTGIFRYQWITPTGLTKELSRDFSPNIFLEVGSAGLGLPTFNIADEKFPFSPLSFITQISTEPRKPILPLVVHADSMEDLVATVEDIHDWFATGDETMDRHNHTPGYFRITRPDDSVRQIACYFVGGMQGDTKEGGPIWTRYAVELYCPDPYPTDLEDVLIVKTPTLATSFGVLNQGRMDAYPIWKIQGPYQNFTLRNVTTDKELEFTYSSPGDEFVIIDTRPSELRNGPSVYDQDDEIQLSRVAPESEYWPLVPGLNNIEWSSSFTNEEITYVQLTYTARYRSLLR